MQVVQDAQGRWNLQQVVELLSKLGGSANAQQQAASTSVPKLPIIKLTNGSIHVTDNQKHTALLEPLNVTGQPNGPLVWKYDLSIADSIALTGVVAPGGNWQHQVGVVHQSSRSAPQRVGGSHHLRGGRAGRLVGPVCRWQSHRHA